MQRTEDQIGKDYKYEERKCNVDFFRDEASARAIVATITNKWVIWE